MTAKPKRLHLIDEIRLPLTVDQKAKIRKAADKDGLSMAAWARRELIRAAAK